MQAQSDTTRVHKFLNASLIPVCSMYFAKVLMADKMYRNIHAVLPINTVTTCTAADTLDAIRILADSLPGFRLHK